ncbi:patatin family protein [Aquibacillus koreensis]|uniref:Patatin family protein n=1 Tax=Aquibacillus koreensis TaxID=279446 RepID=A0A9X3WKT2_9BACI|nr:patatin family protein [Aquibacillus koreensis]MCT2534337.1 patatin family protein [Aquibacillus koreensis]MDC3420658.1 patatin family protein [Aquibacillus koreensis]
MEQTGLILEGGGMRGAYTAGVLDFFHDQDLFFPYVVGSSAGACNGSSYMAKQRGRNYKVLVEYGDHPEYISYTRALRKKELFGMDFLFDTLPNKLVPFDYKEFMVKNSKFVVSATDANSGEAVYYDRFATKQDLMTVVRASSSIPMFAPLVTYNGRNLMDGGIADPIPILPSIREGNTKHVVVLTRNEGYLKKPFKFGWLMKRMYKDYPGLVRSVENRSMIYNNTIETLTEMERRNEVFIIRPNQPLEVSRIERNKEKLAALYHQGYQDAEQLGDKLFAFLNVQKQIPHAQL